MAVQATAREHELVRAECQARDAWLRRDPPHDGAVCQACSRCCAVPQMPPRFLSGATSPPATWSAVRSNPRVSSMRTGSPSVGRFNHRYTSGGRILGRHSHRISATRWRPIRAERPPRRRARGRRQRRRTGTRSRSAVSMLLAEIRPVVLVTGRVPACGEPGRHVRRRASSPPSAARGPATRHSRSRAPKHRASAP